MDETQYLLDTLGVLGARLGAVLFQLPPNLKKDLPRLEAFLDLLGGRVPAAFEFRHASLGGRRGGGVPRRARRGARGRGDRGARRHAAPRHARFAYLRLRKLAYTEAELRGWLARLRELRLDEAYVFFKHEDDGAGPRLAAELLSLAG